MILSSTPAANMLNRTNIADATLPAGAALTAKIAQAQLDAAAEIGLTTVTGGTIQPNK